MTETSKTVLIAEEKFVIEKDENGNEKQVSSTVQKHHFNKSGSSNPKPSSQVEPKEGQKTARAAYARKNSMSQIGADVANASGSASVVIPETKDEGK